MTSSTFSSYSTLLMILVMAVTHRALGALVQIDDSSVEDYLLSTSKATFMMFYGSSCIDCDDISPEWKKLADEWDGHEVGQVAQVDCDDEGSLGICEYFQVQAAAASLPAMVYGGAQQWDWYTGDNDYESLSKFAKEHISNPICAAHVVENCNDEDRAKLESLQGMTTEALEGILEKAHEEMKGLHENFEEKSGPLMEQHNEFVDEFNGSMRDAAKEQNLQYVLNILKKRHNNGAEAEDPSNGEL